MKLRRNSGATLAIVAASIIFILFVALAFYFLSQLIGGGRELQHATNSGTLNVAKQALATPTINVPTGNDQDKIDMKEVLLGVTENNQDRVNLLSFNRMVGQAMLVALNAESDGNAASTDNAGKFVDLVESDTSSIGKSLRDALANGPGWAKDHFNKTAMGNSIRMLGNSWMGNAGQITWQEQDFRIGYFNAGEPSNIKFDSIKKDDGDTHVNNLPFTNIKSLADSNQFEPDRLTHGEMPDGSTRFDTNSHENLLTGYLPLNFPNVGKKIYAVPLDTQPHLVSLTDFAKAPVAKPQDSDTNHIVVPPNTFLNGATGRDDKKSKLDVHIMAAAMAGTNQRPIEASMPFGYIVLDNSATKHFDGVVPNTNNVFAQELGVGIDVDPGSKYFNLPKHNDNESPDPQVRNWETTPRDQNFNPDDGPAWDKIFRPSGELAESAQEVADHIGYQGSTPTAIKCTHSNSDAHSPTPNASCISLASPDGAPGHNGMSPFDWAYHRGEDQSYGSSGPIHTDDLTATEQTGCALIDTWEKATKNVISSPYTANFTFHSTGLGLYPTDHNPIQGKSAPWAKQGKGFNQNIPDGANSYSSDVPCKVTVAGTINQLIDQTMGFTPDTTTVNGDGVLAPRALSQQAQAVEKVIKQRMHEILPATDEVINAEFDRVVKTAKIPLGKVVYLYLNQATQKFVIGTAPPPDKDPALTDAPPVVRRGTLKNHVTTTDGRKATIAKADYGVAMTMADPKNQWGIHDTPFVHINGVEVIKDPGRPPQNGSPTNAQETNARIVAHDIVDVTANSGAFANLLNITFTELTDADSGNLEFTDRD